MPDEQPPHEQQPIEPGHTPAHSEPTPEDAPRESSAKLDHWSPVTEAMRTHADPRFTKQGNPIDPPDPGTGFSRMIALLLTVCVVVFIVAWQNTPDETKQRFFFGKATEVETNIGADKPAPGNFGQVDLMGRMFLRGKDLFKGHNMMSQIDAPGMDFIDEDRVRLIMLYAEFEGTDVALDKLEALRLEMLELEEPAEEATIELSSEDLVLRELDILRTLYTEGQGALREDQTMQLADRYGYIGRVALTHGLPDSDPLRAQLLSGFWRIMLFIVLVGLLVVLGPLAGLVLLVFGMISFFGGRMKMRARVPAPGGSIYLETYALFVLGFAIMAVGTFFVGNSSMPELAAFSLLVQWLLLLTVFWGLVRGARGREWRLATGWHTGEGVLKEIGCGVLAYLASLPFYIIGVLITAALLIAKEIIATRLNQGVPPDPEPLVNPVFEMIANGGFIVVLLLFVLATTWAPIVEESIFRGALYRHLRGRLHWVAAALLTGILFAFMHDYGPLMVAPLIALGFMFAFMREWRGSIIAPMTAHFIHNFTLMIIMVTFVQLIKDPVG